MVFHRRLAAPGNKDNLSASRRHSLFHTVLDQRLIDQRQHLLRHRLGGGKKTRAHARGRKNCFANFCDCHFVSVLLLNGCEINPC